MGMKSLTICAALAVKIGHVDDEDFANGVASKVFGGYITDEFHNTRNGKIPGQETPEIFPEPKANHNSEPIKIEASHAELDKKYKPDYDEEKAMAEISEF